MPKLQVNIILGRQVKFRRIAQKIKKNQVTEHTYTHTYIR